ncbi:MAG: UDP-N-acetylmuramate dehydrogenase [Minisyncoccia bacterium]
MEIRENVPLAPYTTFQIGGPARYFVEVSDEAGVRDALGWAREKGVPFCVIAGGSNLLIPDSGRDGLVIRVAGEKFSVTDNGLEAQAGCVLLDLIRAASAQGLGGWEKLSGIPGTIGGAVRGNAGAFGPEIKDFVTWVRAINTRTEDVHEFSNAECQFDYRMSYFKKNPEWVILDVHVQLGKSEAALIDETIREREKRHIQNVKAAGSYFMNPVAPQKIISLFEQEKQTTSRGGRVPAGWLIEKTGMKGATLGGAQVSPQQANYIINASGSATAEEVRELAQKVKDEVKEQFDVVLTEEAVVL